MSTQTDRVLAALRKAGSRGITASDFTPAEGNHVIDGGGRITRVAARVRDLRDEGYTIVKGPRRAGFDTYVLTGYPPVQGVTVDLGDGWVRTHNCRRCDFHYERPCGPVCPTCEQPARAIVLLDARGPQTTSERKAA